MVRGMSGRRLLFFFGKLDDLGDAAVGRPEHPAVQFGPGLVAGRLGIVRRGSLSRHER